MSTKKLVNSIFTGDKRYNIVKDLMLIVCPRTFVVGTVTQKRKAIF